MITFYKEYNYILPNNFYLTLLAVESKGLDIEDMLSNAYVYLEDWNGSEGPNWDIGDLPQHIYNKIVNDMVECLNNCYEI